MDIAALSYSLNTADIMNQIGFTVLGNALEQVEISSDGMRKILEASVTPGLGQNIDISV